MLEASIFLFSHNVFYPIKDRNHHFINFEFVVCNALNLVQSKNLLFGKGLKSESTRVNVIIATVLQ